MTLAHCNMCEGVLSRLEVLEKQQADTLQNTKKILEMLAAGVAAQETSQLCDVEGIISNEEEFLALEKSLERSDKVFGILQKLSKKRDPEKLKLRNFFTPEFLESFSFHWSEDKRAFKQTKFFSKILIPLYKAKGYDEITARRLVEEEMSEIDPVKRSESLGAMIRRVPGGPVEPEDVDIKIISPSTSIETEPEMPEKKRKIEEFELPKIQLPKLDLTKKENLRSTRITESNVTLFVIYKEIKKVHSMLYVHPRVKSIDDNDVKWQNFAQSLDFKFPLMNIQQAMKCEKFLKQSTMNLTNLVSFVLYSMGEEHDATGIYGILKYLFDDTIFGIFTWSGYVARTQNRVKAQKMILFTDFVRELCGCEQKKVDRILSDYGRKVRKRVAYRSRRQDTDHDVLESASENEEEGQNTKEQTESVLFKEEDMTYPEDHLDIDYEEDE